MKYFISHDSKTTLTGKFYGATFYFPPGVETEVPSKECADAVMNDFNTLLSGFTMKLTLVDEEDGETKETKEVMREIKEEDDEEKYNQQVKELVKEAEGVEKPGNDYSDWEKRVEKESNE